jgi:hypothetical protein
LGHGFKRIERQDLIQIFFALQKILETVFGHGFKRIERQDLIQIFFALQNFLKTVFRTRILGN